MTRDATARTILTPRGGDSGWATALLVLRVAAGLLFITTGVGKFVTFQAEVDHFADFGIPAPTAAVLLAGIVEIVGGVLLALGLLVRPAALALAVTMALAIGTAGRVQGGAFHLGVAPALLVLMLVLVWSGGTRWSIDRVLLNRAAAA
ncbi:MAG: DoxX family protein [Miltoncostaeaceae bacterium]